MTLFSCRACAAKDEAADALVEAHARELAYVKHLHEQESSFLKAQLDALQKQVLALSDRGAYAAIHPRPATPPAENKAPGAHSPSVIRQRREDRPSPEELARAERLAQKLSETLAAHAPAADPNQPDPGPGNGAA